MSALASCAANDNSSRGRLYEEKPSPFRSQYQRDRDRIIHSSAFRRLEYKTQVFLNHEGDMFRTRLTHSIEVSQIGRTIARALSVNEDLTEAISLAHDLGHTPFGHAGQDALNRCMRDYGGFEHNLQSLRVVDVLEQKYADYPGLNLTYETREGILKHCSLTNAKTLGELGQRFVHNLQAGLEAQIANIADEVAYNNHDVDDGLRAGLISIDELKECEIIEQHYQYVTSRWPNITGRQLTNELIRRMINSLVTDVVETSRSRIELAGFKSIEDVRNAGERTISLGNDMQRMHGQLKKYLGDNLYNHENVLALAEQSKHVIRTLFGAYTTDPGQIPENPDDKKIYKNSKQTRDSKECMVKDYIAGMTDRYAMLEYNRITDTQ